MSIAELESADEADTWTQYAFELVIAAVVREEIETYCTSAFVRLTQYPA
jgi:hypothetical protein